MVDFVLLKKGGNKMDWITTIIVVLCLFYFMHQHEKLEKEIKKLKEENNIN